MFLECPIWLSSSLFCSLSPDGIEVNKYPHFNDNIIQPMENSFFYSTKIRFGWNQMLQGSLGALEADYMRFVFRLNTF